MVTFHTSPCRKVKLKGFIHHDTHRKRLLHYFLHQCRIAVHLIVNYIPAADGLEMLSGAVNFHLLHQPELQGGHRALRFCHKIDMLYISFIEGNCPVRIATAYRRGDVETVRQFHLDSHIPGCIQFLGKVFSLEESKTIWS